MENFNNLISKITIDEADKEQILEKTKNHKRKNRKPAFIGIAAALASLILLFALFPYSKNIEKENPLIIAVNAISEDGEIKETELKSGEKIELYEDKKTWEGNYEGFAFDLTLTNARYLGLAALDKNLEIWRYPSIEVIIDGEIWYEPLPDVDIFWAMTPGDEIEVIGVNLSEKNIKEYKEGKWEPWKHGKSLIWVPNEEMNHELIQCYDENYQVIAEYILEMSEENGKYYAEIISAK